MLKRFSIEQSRQVVTRLIDHWLPDADESTVRYAAADLFDAGKIIPLSEFSMWSKGLRCAFARAALSPGDFIMLQVQRTNLVWQGSLDEIAEIILDNLKGDSFVVLFDETFQWTLAVNHSGAISVLGHTGSPVVQ